MPKKTRRKRSTTRAMPETLTLADVEAVMSWPLGQVKTNMCEGEGWTDCIIELEGQIRLGGKYNTRRVRYDGRFYITHNKRSVYIVGMLQLDVFECVGHVYGLDRIQDVAHNKSLKGY